MSSHTVLRCLVIASCATALLAACEQQGASAAAPSSPTAALTAYYEAGKRQDGAALKKLVSAETLKVMEVPGVSVERVLVSMTQSLPTTMPPTRNEKIDGSRATLEMWNAEADRWETFVLVREEGGWKIAVDEMDGAEE